MSTAITTGYNSGQYGYMGIGPTPARSLELTVSIRPGLAYTGWFCGSASKLGIIIYDPTDTTKYAVHKTAELTVVRKEENSYIIVGTPDYQQTYPDVLTEQTVAIDYDPSSWDFFGGFTSADFANKAICFFVKTPTSSGNAPNGTDFASISTNVLTNIVDFEYDVLPEMMANTIDGCNIYAKRAECDKDGEQIDTTYLKKSNLQYFVGRNLHYNQNDKIQTNLPGGTVDAPTSMSNNFTRLTDLSFAGAYCLACRFDTSETYELTFSYNASGTSSTVSFIGTETVVNLDNTVTTKGAVYLNELALYTPTAKMGGNGAGGSTAFDPTLHKAIVYEGVALVGPLSKCTIAIWNDNGTVKIALTAIEVGKVGATN